MSVSLQYIATVMYRPGSTGADISARFVFKGGSELYHTALVVLSRSMTPRVYGHRCVCEIRV